MTVSQALHCAATDEIIRTSHVLLYPAHIPAQHHQLRHLVSSAEEGRIYYASNYDVYALELDTHNCTLVATLPFTIQSLVAGHGWVCVGGSEEGHCAFMKIVRDAQPEKTTTQPGHLPPPSCFGHDLTVQELGGEIVNSMNIHQFADGPHNETETVVLISNNDKTVKIYSLNQHKVLTTLKHPCPMNYANLSPDSNLLVACGDTDRVFFYKRVVVDEEAAVYSWKNIADPKIPVHGDENDHSFSVAFSQSGKLCAVSSQGGTIVVFDLTNIDQYAEEKKAEVAILCSFRSARESTWGSIRSMAFSPEPWDLLAWAEDYGRIGIADVRQHFVRRQILNLDKHLSGLTTIDVHNVTPAACTGLTVKERLQKQDAQRMLIESQDHHDSPAPSPPPTEAWAEEARLRQSRRQPTSSHQGHDLNSHELSVLGTLDVNMDDVLPLNSNGLRPYSVSYTSSPQFRPSAGNVPLGPTVRVDRSYVPRRQTSVVLSPSRNDNESHPSTLAPRELSRTRQTASPSHIPPSNNDRPATPDDLPPLMSTNDLTPQAGNSSSQPLPYDIPSSDPWANVQATLESARALDNEIAGYREQSSGLGDDDTSRPHPQVASENLASISGESSALPTTAVRPTATDATRDVLIAIGRQEAEQRRLNAEQRHQNARLENLERQLRRESLAAAAAVSDLEAMEIAMQRGSTIDRHTRGAEIRAQGRARNAIALTSFRAEGSLNSVTSALRDQIRPTRDDIRLHAAERAFSERASEERRMRMMYQHRARQATDQNGNWMPSTVTVPLARLSEIGMITRRAESEELQRERGLGSTGVGWSADGLTLYCGSEQGIFEFQVNARDRMQFPALELR